MIWMVSLAVREKLDLPFSFDSQDEAPARMATVRSNLPELGGICGRRPRRCGYWTKLYC